MSDPDDDFGQERSRTRRSLVAPWLRTALFLGGLVTGVLLTGLLNATTPNFVSQQQQAASASPTPSGGAGTVEVAAQARVNSACLRVINSAQDVYGILSGAGKRHADMDLQQLDDLVRRLQPIEIRLQRDLSECEVDTSGGVPTDAPTDLPSGQTDSAAPTVVPTGEPTGQQPNGQQPTEQQPTEQQPGQPTDQPTG